MDEEQSAAADKIAAVKKGQKARKDAAEKKQAATTVGAAARGRRERKARKKEDESAVAIQSRVRGRKVRTRGTHKDGDGKQRYYTPAEVAMHNTADDCWVSFFNKVVDLTPLIKENVGHLVQPLIDAAGTDITHWFDPVTKDVRTYIDSKTELEVPFTPMGTFLHCPPSIPTSDWSSSIGTVWWRDRTLVLGKLTLRTRRIKLENMLTKQKTELEVCAEETLQVPCRTAMHHLRLRRPCVLGGGEREDGAGSNYCEDAGT